MHDMSHMGKHAIGLHGMLIVGDETIYLSHLPMWMSPHNFQVILEVTFTGSGEPQARYVEDRKQTGTRLYTLQPADTWDIRDLTPTGPENQPQRSSFRATIWRNHFEHHPDTHPGERFQIARDVTVNIGRVILFRELDPNGPGADDLRYLLFGAPQELFLAHALTRAPDFDHFLSADVGEFFEHQPAAWKDEIQERVRTEGVEVSFPGRPNGIPQRVKEGERLTGQVRLAEIHSVEDVEITAGIEYYFETEDLASPEPASMQM